MEPKGSLPQSQVPAACPYPELAQSSPYSHIPLPEDPPYYYPPINKISTQPEYWKAVQSKKLKSVLTLMTLAIYH
jgi:hypothetical protein